MNTIWTITRLTIRETQRRRILWVALFAGLAFLAIFGLGYHYIFQELEGSVSGQRTAELPRTISSLLVTMGLYVVHFLGIALAALLSAGTLSGEIESHTIDTLLTKPLARWQVVVGKWLAFALLLLAYMAALTAGILLLARLRSGFTLTNPLPGLALLMLSALAMLSVSMLGGTRLSTLANGTVAFTLYSLAFVGGWIEQIGALLRNTVAVDLGIFSSLVMPSDALWKRAALLWQPENIANDNLMGPFFVVSQPSPLMTQYAVLYTILLLLAALWSFSRRDL